MASCPNCGRETDSTHCPACGVYVEVSDREWAVKLITGRGHRSERHREVAVLAALAALTGLVWLAFGAVVLGVLAGGAPDSGGSMAVGLGLVHLVIAVGLLRMAKPAHYAFTVALLAEVVAGVALWGSGYTLFGLGVVGVSMLVLGYHVEQRRLYRV